MSIAISGCSSDAVFEPNGTDNVADAGTTTNADSESTGTDAGTETGTSAGSDAGMDTGSSDGTDTGTDGEVVSVPVTIGDANCPPLRASGGSVSIAGLYGLSNEPAFAGNVIYLEIADNGAGTVYTYQQNNLIQGGNCYTKAPGFMVFSPVVDDLYIFTSYEDADINCEISNLQTTIVKSESQLRFISSDTDENGVTTEMTIINWPVLSGISSESFNECV